MAAATHPSIAVVWDFASPSYINGYDDTAVIAGAGTIGLEVIDQCPGLDALVIPCGGGGA